MSKSVVAFAALIVILSLSVGIVLSQDTDSLTPLPTKTPTPIPEISGDEPSTTQDIPDFDIEEPFIQSDLSILSGNVQRPNGLFWHNDMIYASCSGDWTIYEIDAETGATITYIWGIRNAHELHIEDGVNGEPDIWAPDFQTNSLMRISNGSLATISSELEGPWGIAAHNDNFLVTNLLANELVSVSRNGEIQELATGFRSPAGLVIDQDSLYVANNGSARRAIEWLDIDQLDSAEQPLDTTEDGVVQSLVSGLQSVTGLQMGPDGYLYFAYSLGTRGVVGRVQPEVCQDMGGCTNDQVEIVVYTDLAAPLAGLAMSPDMKLYTHTIFSPDIYYVSIADAETQTAQR